MPPTPPDPDVSREHEHLLADEREMLVILHKGYDFREDTLRSNLAAAPNRIAVLRARVAGLEEALRESVMPRTNDGVVVTPGMFVYREFGVNLHVKELTVMQIGLGQAIHDGISWRNAGTVFSTREAALAAQPPTGGM